MPPNLDTCPRCLTGTLLFSFTADALQCETCGCRIGNIGTEPYEYDDDADALALVTMTAGSVFDGTRVGIDQATLTAPRCETAPVTWSAVVALAFWLDWNAYLRSAAGRFAVHYAATHRDTKEAE